MAAGASACQRLRDLPPVTDENACIAINYTSGTTGFPKGVMFTHRGAWINAIGEITEHGLTQRSVYLWTLPLFHCNGWCFSWAVTAAGGRHICLRQPDPREAVRLIEAEGVTHLCGAPVVVSSLAQYCAANGVKFRNPAAHRHRRSAAAARRDPRRRGDRRRNHPRLRPHRNLRSAHHLRLEARLGRAARGRARPAQSPPGRPLHGRRHGPAGGRPLHERRPRRRPDHGRSPDARQQRHARLLRQSQSHRGGLSRAAGSTPATSPWSTPTATSNCATA